MILGPLTMETMRLEHIAIRLGVTSKATSWMDTEIKGLAYDSRQVKPGFLFIAIPGQRQDGVHFIDDALKRGASAVVGEGALALRHVPYLRVPNARHALADIACMFFGNPSSALAVYGVTGTNGKTTTAFMIRALLAGQGRRPGLISTVRYEIGQRNIPANRTTPEAPDLQAMLQKMDRAGCDSVAMEVSSHALDQERVRGIDYDVAVFTNLTRDHLDYHASMDEYFAAKCRLFTELGQGPKEAVAIVNLDDPRGADLVRIVGEGPAVCLTYGMQPGADVVAEHVRLDARGSRCTVKTPWGDAPLRLKQLGRFNVSNALAAIAACGAGGMPVEELTSTLADMADVPGRLESLTPQHPFNVFVDYAHTDDALQNVLVVLREITRGRIRLVFGCGGDRDRSKRPAMGRVAQQYADYTVITSDNPRSEEPETIAKSIAAGFTHRSAYTIELDREAAIRQAVYAAKPGDTVLVAGKGHEHYQEFAHTIIPFDDGEMVRKALEEQSR